MRASGLARLVTRCLRLWGRARCMASTNEETGGDEDAPVESSGTMGAASWTESTTSDEDRRAPGARHSFRAERLGLHKHPSHVLSTICPVAAGCVPASGLDVASLGICATSELSLAGLCPRTSPAGTALGQVSEETQGCVTHSSRRVDQGNNARIRRMGYPGEGQWNAYHSEAAQVCR